MKRWGAPIVVVLLCFLAILLSAPRSADMLADTDTRVLMQKLEERNAPLSWFGTDWPLENHFYRPVSTLTFELDRALHPNDPGGFGFISALLCGGCVLALFWFLRELTDDAALSTAGTLLFTIWTLRPSLMQQPWLHYLAWIVAVLGFLRHGLKLKYWLPAALALAYLPLELAGVHSAEAMGGFRAAVLNWLPGRTATVMTLFCLLAMAAYARYERTGAVRENRPPSPLDPPATKSTRPTQTAKAGPTMAVLAVGFAALALGSYEQAVMLPAVLTGTAVTMRLRGYRVRWGWQAGFWALLVGYLMLRRQVIPGGTSGYQAQQFRDGMGVWISLVAYLMPSLTGLLGWLQYLQVQAVIFLTPAPYSFPIELGGNIAAFWAARKHLALALAGWGMSVLAFLPMAWLKPFAHYHYWPMALRSLLVATLGWVVWDLVVTAVSPRGLQAPPRPSPAPGSLPRP